MQGKPALVAEYNLSSRFPSTVTVASNLTANGILVGLGVHEQGHDETVQT